MGMKFFNSKNSEGQDTSLPTGLFLSPEGGGPDAPVGQPANRGNQSVDVEDVVARPIPHESTLSVQDAALGSGQANNGRRSLDLGGAPHAASKPAAPAPAPTVPGASSGQKRSLNLGGGKASAPLPPAYAAPPPSETPAEDVQQGPIRGQERSEHVLEVQPPVAEASNLHYEPAPEPVVVEEVIPQPTPAPQASAPGMKMNFKRKASGDSVTSEQDTVPEKKGFSAFAKLGSKTKGSEKTGGILKAQAAKKEKGANPLGSVLSRLFAKKPLPEAAGATVQEASPASDAGVPKAPKKPLWSFGKKASKTNVNASDVSDSTSAAAEQAPKRKRGFSFGKPKNAAGADKPEKPAKGWKSGKTEKPKAGSKKGKSPAVDFQYILVQLTRNEDLLWKIGPESIEKVPMDALKGTKTPPMASFTQEDIRIFVDAPQSYGRASELALQALDEKPRLINLSKTHNAILTTPASRLQRFKSKRVGPGLMLLEGLLKDFFDEKFQSSGTMRDFDVISGFMLQDTNQGDTMVILYHYEKNGDIVGPEVVVNPADVNMTLRSFAAGRKVDASKAEFRLYRNAELLAAGVPKYLYPSDAVLMGLPVTQALAGAALVSTVVAVGSSAFAFQQYVAKESLKSRTKVAKAKADDHAANLKKLMSSSVTSLAKKQSIPIDAFVGQAAKFWVKGALVQMNATATQQRYAIHLATVPKTDISMGPSVLDGVTPKEVQALMDLQVPENCSKQSPSVNGTLDVIQLVITCETPPGALHRYSLD